MQAGTSFFSDVPALFLKNHKRFHLTREFRKPLRGQPEPAFLFFDRNVLPLFMQYSRVFDTPDPQKADKALFFCNTFRKPLYNFPFCIKSIHSFILPVAWQLFTYIFKSDDIVVLSGKSTLFCTGLVLFYGDRHQTFATPGVTCTTWKAFLSSSGMNLYW